MHTYLKSTLASASAGIYTRSQPVPKLGWQNKGCYVFAVRHDESVTAAHAKRAAERTTITIPPDGAPEDDWIFDYEDLGPGREVRRGRPVKDAEAATAHIHLRVTPDRKSTYVRKAQATGQSLSNWMTETCDREAGYQP